MFAVLIICLLILSYILTDFISLSDHPDQRKREDLVNVLKETGLFLFCSIFLTCFFLSLKLVIIIAVLSGIYLTLRIAFIFLRDERKHGRTFVLVVTDYLLHTLAIIAAYPFLQHVIPNESSKTLLLHLNHSYPFFEVFNTGLLSYIVLVTAGLLFSIRGGTVMSLIIINLPKQKQAHIRSMRVQAIMEKAERETAAAAETIHHVGEFSTLMDEERMKRYGKIIGIVERILIIAAILISQFEIIVILTAIKSIGRFKEITNKTSDYYIIGNFASFSIAFFIGFMLLGAKKYLLG